MPDRLPPFDAQAEAGILGCMLLDPQATVPEVAARGGDIFYEPRHRAIFEAGQRLLDAGRSIDPSTLQIELSASGKLHEAGGVMYLAALPDATPSAANLPYFLETVVAHAVRRKIIAAGTRAVNEAYGPRDAMAVLDETGKAFSEIGRDAVGENEVAMPELVDGAIRRLEEAFHRGTETEGIPTGWSDLDRMTRGLKPQEMFVVAGRPSTGKTSLAMNIAEHVSTDLDMHVGVFSLEMSKESLVQRMLCSRAEVDERKFSNRDASENDFRALTRAQLQLKRANLHIDDSGGLNVNQIRARARRMHRKHGIKLLVVDYLQLVRGTRRDGNRQAEVAEISNGIKALLKELNIPGVILAQLNRELDKDKLRKPRLSDLRESGAIEQDADIIGMLYSTVENPEGETIIPVNLLIAKQRNGPTGDVPFTFFKPITRFKPGAKV